MTEVRIYDVYVLTEDVTVTALQIKQKYKYSSQYIFICHMLMNYEYSKEAE